LSLKLRFKRLGFVEPSLVPFACLLEEESVSLTPNISLKIILISDLSIQSSQPRGLVSGSVAHMIAIRRSLLCVILGRSVEDLRTGRIAPVGICVCHEPLKEKQTIRQTRGEFASVT
jgi:hypothetical protein